MKRVFHVLLLLTFSELYLAFAPCTVRAQGIDPDKEFQFANKLYEDKLFKLAGDQFRDFAKHHPSHAQADDALFFGGESYFSEGSFEAAFNIFKELELGYPQSPHLPLSRYRLAECRLALGDFAAAAELLRRIPVLHPKSENAAKAHFAAGQAFLQAGNTVSALESFMNLIRNYPDSPKRMDAHLAVVNLYLSEKKTADALNEIDGIFHAFGPEIKDARVYWLRGQIFERLGQPAEAEAIYQRLSNQFSGSVDAAQAELRLAYLHGLSGDYAQAVSKYEAVLPTIEAVDQKAEGLQKQGDFQQKLGEYDGALASYQQGLALSQTSSHPALFFSYTKLLMKLSRFQEAESSLLQFSEFITANKQLASDSSEVVKPALLLLIDVLAGNSKPYKALEEIRRFKRNFIDRDHFPKLTFQSARIHEDLLNDYGKASREYEQFVEQYPQSDMVDEAQYRLGLCYEKLGHFKMALAKHAEHLQRFPASDRYNDVLKREKLIQSTVKLGSSEATTGLSILLSKIASNSVQNVALELGKLELKAKNFQSAINHFRSAAHKTDADSSQAELMFLLGKAHLLAGDRLLLQADEAKTSYDSAAIVLDALVESAAKLKDLSEYQRLLAYVHQQLDQPALADTLENRRVRFESASVPITQDFWLAIGNAHYFNRTNPVAMESALKYFELVLLADSVHQEAQFKRIVCADAAEGDSVQLARLNKFIDAYPQSRYLAEAYWRRAKTAVAIKDTAAASADFEHIVTNFPYASIATRAQVALADLYFAKQDFQSALSGYASVRLMSVKPSASDETDWSQIDFHQAQALERIGKKRLALAHYVDFSRRYAGQPLSVMSMFATARLASEFGNTALAQQFYESLLRASTLPEHQYKGNVAIADILFDKKAYGDARAFYTAAVKHAETEDAKRYVLARQIRCRYGLMQLVQAEQDLKFFTKNYKNTRSEEGQFLHDLGRAYVADKNFEAAEKSFKKLMKEHKNTDWGARGEFGLGEVYLITNHTEDALKILTNIPTKYPESEVTPLTYFNLGDFYAKSGQINNAIHAFKQVLLHPKSNAYQEKALLYLIQSYNDARMWDQAIALTRDYLQKYPRAPQAFRKKIDLAQLLMKLKEYGRAIEHFQRLLPYADKDSQAEIQFYVAQCYKDSGNFEQAVTEYLKVKYLTAPTKLPWHITALFETGRCLLKINQIEQAVKIFRRIIRERGTESNFGRFAAKQLAVIEEKRRSDSDQ